MRTLVSRRDERREPPKQATIISRKTARGLFYLESHGLASFEFCRLVVDYNKGPKSPKGWVPRGVGV